MSQVEVEYWDGTGVEPSVLEAHVRELAAKQPDHVYDYTNYPDGCFGSNCKYTHTLLDDSEVPGCIIGQAIFNITGKLVRQSDNNGGVLDFAFMRDHEYNVNDGGWSRRAKFLANVQSHQDNRDSWGKAVERADDLSDTGNWWV